MPRWGFLPGPWCLLRLCPCWMPLGPTWEGLCWALEVLRQPLGTLRCALLCHLLRVTLRSWLAAPGPQVGAERRLYQLQPGAAQAPASGVVGRGGWQRLPLLPEAAPVGASGLQTVARWTEPWLASFSHFWWGAGVSLDCLLWGLHSWDGFQRLLNELWLLCAGCVPD